MRTWSVLPLVLLLSACARNVEVGFPGPGGVEAPGHVVVTFTEPMASVTVQMNDVLLVEREHTGRIDIGNLPPGDYLVTVAASESSRSRSVRHVEPVTVEARRTATLVIDTPPQSTGYWIQSSVILLWPLVLVVAR